MPKQNNEPLWQVEDPEEKHLLEPELFAELNAAYPDDDEDADCSEQKSSPITRRIIALGLASVFLIYVIFSAYSFHTRSSSSFLRESRQLKTTVLVQELQKAVVEIRGIESLTSRSERRGTGFNISPEGLVVTNRHLVDDVFMVIVSFPHGKTYHIYEWDVHPDVDLALIYLESAELPTVSVNVDGFLGIGAQVTVIGNPLGFSLVAMQGTVANYRRFNRRSDRIMEIIAPIHRGSSGSPVFNDQGDVVAVVYATIPHDEASEIRGLAVPIVRLLDILD